MAPKPRTSPQKAFQKLPEGLREGSTRPAKATNQPPGNLPGPVMQRNNNARLLPCRVIPSQTAPSWFYRIWSEEPSKTHRSSLSMLRLYSWGVCRGQLGIFIPRNHEERRGPLSGWPTRSSAAPSAVKTLNWFVWSALSCLLVRAANNLERTCEIIMFVLGFGQWRKLLAPPDPVYGDDGDAHPPYLTSVWSS